MRLSSSDDDFSVLWFLLLPFMYLFIDKDIVYGLLEDYVHLLSNLLETSSLVFFCFPRLHGIFHEAIGSRIFQGVSEGL